MLSKASIVAKHTKSLLVRSSPICASLQGRNFLTISDTQESISSPLVDLKDMAHSKGLCDKNGCRLPDTHWAFVMSATSSFDAAPNTRTLNFQRITDEGVDFVCKKKAESIFDFDRPVSFLYTDGKYKPGHKVTQWRGEGVCKKIPLEDVLAYVPEYTLTEVVASCRARKFFDNTSERLCIQGTKSKFIEIVQQTRADLANSQISLEELNQSLQAWKFVPRSLEKMTGGTDEIMWDRWEFDKEGDSDSWREPRQLMPY